VTASYFAGTGAGTSGLSAGPATTATSTKVTTTTTVLIPPPSLRRTTTPVAPVAASSYDATDSNAGRTLPATAGPMPLVALIGLLGAGGAATIRRFRRS
jgi:hypothetical protein